MKVRKIGVMSFAKTWAVLNALFGVVTGLIFSVFSLLGVAIGFSFFGVFSILVLPVLYGFIGFFWGILMAFFLNIALGIAGGIDLQE